ncbi:MAG TPA: AsmA-like C-terminal region-containing protein, partial [Pirellulales bacterium]|nr:AsmA-like C-terminal region-containing protein [Pirellulales bacterium]
SLAGGSLQAAGRVPLEDAHTGYVSFGLENVQLQQLLAPWPEYASTARGSVNMRLQGRVAEVCRFEGVASARDVDLEGVHIGELRFPFDAVWEPRSGRGKLVSQEAHAQVAQGRMTGQVEVDVLHTIGMHGKINLANVDLRSLERSLSSSQQFGSGTVQGTVVFDGKNMRSINDLTATMNLKLKNSQAMTLPVLDQIGPLLSAGLSTATKFQTGELQGTLAHGIVRIRRFTLSSPTVQVFAKGSAAVAGRLDLEVVVRTGEQGANGPLAMLALNRLALTTAGPVGWVIEANELMSNRVINAHVGGTMRHPTVQVKPVALLANEALRFFLSQAGGGAALP